MASFTNQATLRYNGLTVASNVVTGQVVSPITLSKTAVEDVYAPGDTITITEDTVLKAQWSRTPEEMTEIVDAIVNWVPRVFTALWRNFALRVADLFTK